jgi:hypothetical protein
MAHRVGAFPVLTRQRRKTSDRGSLARSVVAFGVLGLVQVGPDASGLRWHAPRAPRLSEIPPLAVSGWHDSCRKRADRPHGVRGGVWLKEHSSWDSSVFSLEPVTRPAPSATSGSLASSARTSSAPSIAMEPASAATARARRCLIAGLARVGVGSSAVGAPVQVSLTCRRRLALAATGAVATARARLAAVAPAPARFLGPPRRPASAQPRKAGRAWSAASARDPAPSP